MRAEEVVVVTAVVRREKEEEEGEEGRESEKRQQGARQPFGFLPRLSGCRYSGLPDGPSFLLAEWGRVVNVSARSGDEQMNK